MFNLSFGELLILSVLGLIVLGPKQLPQVAKVLGRTYNEFKKAFQDVTHAVKSEMKVDMLKKTMNQSISGAILSESTNSIAQENLAKPEVAKTEKKSIEEVLKELGK